MSMFDAFRERRPFPGQDPWVVPHDDSFLLVQSAGGNRRIVVKRFHDLQRMDRNVETVIWSPAGGTRQHREVWAPELHQLEGRWYLYFAAGDGQAANHRMFALVADDPFGPFTELGPVRDPRHDVWAIDMTVFAHDGKLYALWSGWEGPHDGFPQNLYIAPMATPWTISGDRRCLSRPEYGWETSVAPVNEGPTVIRHTGSGRLFILYAADASWTSAYKTGLIEWTGGDITDPRAWRKSADPWFSGGGHGCVVDTAVGSHFVYHRKLTGEPGWADREIRSVPLFWDADGYPLVQSVAPRAGEAARAATSIGAGFTPGGPPSQLERAA
jgi:GH43 family beta-xylosidase